MNLKGEDSLKAAFLVGLTTEGPKLLTIYPDNPKLVSESFRNELTLKCMPIGAKDGDFHSFIVDHVQIISIIIQLFMDYLMNRKLAISI